MGTRTGFLLISICLSALAMLANAQDKAGSVQAYNKGLQLMSQGKFRESLKSFDLSIQRDSSNYNAWIKRGFVRAITGDFAGEMSDYTFVINVVPEHAYAYVSRGSAFNKLKEYSKAIVDFDSALRIDTSSQEAYNNRGFARKGLGDMEGACADWQQSKKLGNAEATLILQNNHCK
jgi:tetratricopeptide (TPR) repeat protein